MKREINRLTWRDRRGGLRQPLTLAVCPDLHSEPYDDLLPALREADAIVIPGDLLNRHDPDQREPALGFLRACGETAPTLYAPGNHERRIADAHLWWEAVRALPVRVLDDTCFRLREDVAVAGFCPSGRAEADEGVLDRLSREDGFRLLLCHHPEHYQRYVSGREIDLTLAGHAHGGQFRLFGRGLYAPGQGFFPRLTSGWYDGGALLVSRGLSNHGIIPRLNNPCELILLTLLPADA